MTRFELLGPIRAIRDGSEIELGGARQRLVLVLLLLRSPEVVAAERLVVDVWGEHEPATAAKTLQVYVSRLRKILDEGELETAPGGYRIAAADVDVQHVEELRTLASAAEPLERASLLREALSTWRGAALADLRYEDALAADVARLDELRLVLLEDRVDADLSSGGERALVPELEAAIREHPLRERLRAAYMLTLYRLGRQTDALASYQEWKAQLDEELGLEPGPAMRDLERRILVHDPELGAPAVPTSRLSVRRRRVGLLLGLAALALLVAAGGIAVVASRPSGASVTSVRADALVSLGPDGRLGGALPVDGSPVAVAVGPTSVWVASEERQSLTRVDRRTGRSDRVALPLVPAAVVVADGTVWVGGKGRPGLAALDPIFGHLLRTVTLPADAPLDVTALAAREGYAWVSDRDEVRRFDARTGAAAGRYALANVVVLAGSRGGVVYAGTRDGRVARIDPVSGIGATTRVTDWVRALAPAGRFGWVLGRYSGTLWKLDADSLAVLSVAQLDEESGGTESNGVALAAAGNGVWVADDTGLSEVVPVGDDPALTRIGRRIRLSSRPAALAVATDGVWLATTSVGTPLDARGTLRFNRPDDGAESIDPALDWSPVGFQRAFATCARLLTYPDRADRAGATLVPELAAGLPRVSQGGRTYGFRVRQGFRFAPPSGEAVTAADVKATVERATSPEWPGGQTPGAGFVSDLVGFDEYRTGRSGHIAGIVVRGSTISFTLRAPAPDFPARLAMPFFCTLPRGTPVVVGGLGGPIPTAGPYYVASGRASDRPHRIVLERNPSYTGQRLRTPARIVYEIGPDGAETASALAAGATDYSDGQLMDATYERMLREAGPDTEAAKAGRQRLFVGATFDTGYLVLNAARPLFGDPRLRARLTRAVDRAGLTRAWFGLRAGATSDQYLPPGFPGFVDVALAPPGGVAPASLPPATRRARLVIPSDPLAFQEPQEFVAVLRTSLRRIGVELDVRRSDDLGRDVAGESADFDISVLEFEPDLPDPSSVLNHLFETGRAASDGLTAATTSRYSSKELDRRLRAAAALTGEARRAAYASIDHDLARTQAPMIPLGTFAQFDAFSARVGCQLYHPLYGMVLGALCLDRTSG